MHSDHHIRVAQPQDAEALGIIGPAIYAESYGHMWDDAGAYADYLMTFGSSAVGDFIGRTDTRMWLVEVDRRVVGFLSLVLHSPDPVDRRTDGAEVPRIYMLAPCRGRGVGTKLVAEAERYAREEGADHLWLDAMKAAPWAWQTYHRWGFREIGQTWFPAGIPSSLNSMVVMRRRISS
jgi:GNAT superfamily N-acetyltransferase